MTKDTRIKLKDEIGSLVELSKKTKDPELLCEISEQVACLVSCLENFQDIPGRIQPDLLTVPARGLELS